MLLSALGSNSKPGLLTATARGGFAIGVWGLAPESFSGAGKGAQYAAVPNDELTPIDWARSCTVREFPAKSAGSHQPARQSVLLPRKQSRHLANFRTVLNKWLSPWLGCFSLQKER
jgi:hypothetical protein